LSQAKADFASAGRVLLVGCGKMGGALLEGWLAKGLARDAVAVVEPNAGAKSPIPALASAEAVPAGFKPDTVLLAVKPQTMDQAAPAYRRYMESGALALSIAAGTPIAKFAAYYGPNAAIIRAMPNTPASVGRGITVLVANARVNADQRKRAEILLGAVGETVWIDDEAQMHAVTAVSGSGPAYVFHLVEAMAAAGAAQGLPAPLAERLARATVAGAGELLHRAPESAAQLRINVSSPGGTTLAALGVLMDAGNGLPPLMAKAVAAATRRSKELAG